MTASRTQTRRRATDRFSSERRRAVRKLENLVPHYPLPANERRYMLEGAQELLQILGGLGGSSVQEKWESFEETLWPLWDQGQGRIPHWNWSVRALVVARQVRPGWSFLSGVRVAQWFQRLPEGDAFAAELTRLKEAVFDIGWVGPDRKARAYALGVKLLLTCGYQRLEQITDDDLRAIPSFTHHGLNALDAALCAVGVFDRTPQQGSTRRHRRERRSVPELVEDADIPERFKDVTILYLETYSLRISSVYATLRHKLVAVARLWRFIDDNYPEIISCADISPAHARAFIPYQIEQARKVRRGGDDDDRLTAHSWLLDVRTFFADICTWATEEGSPFAIHAPATIPLTRHDLLDIGFESARRRRAARAQASALDLEREVPKLRAYVSKQWQAARDHLQNHAGDAKGRLAERNAFWDWAILELLIQSGVRIEEACELTTLDILKRQVADGRVYYLLHIKPSKFDRARVIPIGDGLGRVLAEIIRHIKDFYGSNAVPACSHWDHHEKRPRPRAPYLLQGAKHPSAIGISTIRGHLRRLSIGAGLRKADGSQLILRPHDCRRLFASEHLNNDTPVHVIQALLGHATIGTVMVYAKLYPRHLVESYRKSIRGNYADLYGTESLRNPTKEEWERFSQTCSMRDMGTHMCALPAGDHCPRGLVCLGCSHAQPKKSAAPIFLGMLNSHTAALDRARDGKEPAGQIAARELEIERIASALRRAEDLSSDVAAAIEAEAVVRRTSQAP